MQVSKTFFADAFAHWQMLFWGSKGRWQWHTDDISCFFYILPHRIHYCLSVCVGPGVKLPTGTRGNVALWFLSQKERNKYKKTSFSLLQTFIELCHSHLHQLPQVATSLKSLLLLLLEIAHPPHRPFNKYIKSNLLLLSVHLALRRAAVTQSLPLTFLFFCSLLHPTMSLFSLSTAFGSLFPSSSPHFEFWFLPRVYTLLLLLLFTPSPPLSAPLPPRVSRRCSFLLPLDVSSHKC